MCALSVPRNWNTLAPALVVIMILLLLKKPRPVRSPTASSAATGATPQAPVLAWNCQ